MSLSLKPPRPRTVGSVTSSPTTKQLTLSGATTISTHLAPPKLAKKLAMESPPKNLALSIDSVDVSGRARLNKRWMEYQGIKNWEGLLDPLDENLRGEIIRYGHFVEAAYRSFDFDPSSASYATCRYSKKSLLDKSGFPGTGYRVTKTLQATSGIQLPWWVTKGPSWVAQQSSWIGYVAVCQDKREIARLGRRDVVVSLRGTATCLEWLENLRASLTPVGPLHNVESGPTPVRNVGLDGGEPMVESGFLSLYTSGADTRPSLQYLIREEIKRILEKYGSEPLSLTITGHSLGAALATLTAYDIKTAFNRPPLVTVVSFGGPRVGNGSFRRHLERRGIRILRIVNSDDLVTKLPGFVIGEDDQESDVSGNREVRLPNLLPGWIQKRVEETQCQWVYADVGRELRLSSRNSPDLAGINVAACHELKTYLHLVNSFESSACPFRATAKRMMTTSTKKRAFQF